MQNGAVCSKPVVYICKFRYMSGCCLKERVLLMLPSRLRVMLHPVSAGPFILLSCLWPVSWLDTLSGLYCCFSIKKALGLINKVQQRVSSMKIHSEWRKLIWPFVAEFKGFEECQAENCCSCKILALKTSMEQNGRALKISCRGFNNTKLFSFTCSHCRNANQA